MKITSTAFKEGERMPSKYTCDGENISPGLSWDDIPDGTKSLVLIMDDPDVPKERIPSGLFVHWVVFNIPPEIKIIEENSVPENATVGVTTRGMNAYAGPCPPDREHRYFFNLYALDAMLNLSENTGKDEVLSAMDGHVIGKAELIGLYERIKK